MSTIAIPPSGLEQRRTALRKANRVRTEHAHLKRQVAALGKVQGPRFMATLVETAAPQVESMRVEDALRAVPGVGVDKARRIRKLAGSEGRPVSPLLRIGEVPWRRRQGLASELRLLAMHAEERR